MVPIAHGNDGGGSTRIPAACCGLVGLKAARGRVSVGPDAGDSLLVQDGVLTRTVAETAAVLDVLAGYELGDATWAPPVRSRLPSSPGATRAASHRAGAQPAARGGDARPGVRRAARDAAALLESLGHSVEEITPPWSNQDVLSDFTRAFGADDLDERMVGGRLRGPRPDARGCRAADVGDVGACALDRRVAS